MVSQLAAAFARRGNIIRCWKLPLHTQLSLLALCIQTIPVLQAQAWCLGQSYSLYQQSQLHPYLSAFGHASRPTQQTPVSLQGAHTLSAVVS